MSSVSLTHFWPKFPRKHQPNVLNYFCELFSCCVVIAFLYSSVRRILRHFANFWLKPLVSSAFIISTHSLLPLLHINIKCTCFQTLMSAALWLQKIQRLADNLVLLFAHRASTLQHRTAHKHTKTTQCTNWACSIGCTIHFCRCCSPARRSLAASGTKTQQPNGAEKEQRRRPPHTTQHSNHRVSPQLEATLRATHQPNREQEPHKATSTTKILSPHSSSIKHFTMIDFKCVLLLRCQDDVTLV